MCVLRSEQPGQLKSGLFCVTSFRTRGCTPCDACGIYPSALCGGNNLLTQIVPAAKSDNPIPSARPSTENVVFSDNVLLPLVQKPDVMQKPFSLMAQLGIPAYVYSTPGMKQSAADAIGNTIRNAI